MKKRFPAAVANKFQHLSELFSQFVAQQTSLPGAEKRMHREHARVRDLLMAEDGVEDVWDRNETAWASALSGRAQRRGHDPDASWRSFFLDLRALERAAARRNEHTSQEGST